MNNHTTNERHYRDLIEIVQFIDRVATEIHGSPTEDIVFETVNDGFKKMKS